MKKDLISIIVPVYNVECYLNRCIDSIINQTYKKMEIILIDDGSTDNSGKICDDYAKKDKRIFVYHNTNHGVAYTRNFGIKKSKGVYISFVDSDDYIANNYIDRLHSLAINNTAVISSCNHIKFMDKVNIKNKKCKEYTYSNIEAINNMLYQKELDCSFWGKMISKELFNNITIADYHIFEDMDTMYRLFYKSKRIVHTSETLYYYYVRNNSLIHSRSNQDNEIIIEILNNIEKNIDCDLIKKSLLSRKIDAYFNIVGNSKSNDLYYYNAKEFIKKNRKNVLMDKNIKKKTKYAIYLSFFGFGFIKLYYKLK